LNGCLGNIEPFHFHTWLMYTAREKQSIKVRRHEGSVDIHWRTVIVLYRCITLVSILVESSAMLCWQ